MARFKKFNGGQFFKEIKNLVISKVGKSQNKVAGVKQLASKMIQF